MKRKKQRSPAQRAATARMLAANKARRGFKRRRPKSDFTASVPRRKKTQRRRGRNPATKTPRGSFQVAAVRKGRTMFLSGVGLSDNRSAASNYTSLATARKIAQQLRGLGSKFGISHVAIVTLHDTTDSIRRYSRDKSFNSKTGKP